MVHQLYIVHCEIVHDFTYSIPLSTNVLITSLMTSRDVGSPLCLSGSQSMPVQTQNFRCLASRMS